MTQVMPGRSVMDEVAALVEDRLALVPVDDPYRCALHALVHAGGRSPATRLRLAGPADEQRDHSLSRNAAASGGVDEAWRRVAAGLASALDVEGLPASERARFIRCSRRARRLARLPELEEVR